MCSFLPQEAFAQRPGGDRYFILSLAIAFCYSKIASYTNHMSGIDREIYLENRTSLIDQWEFAEIWVDPWLSPPYILMLVKEQSGKFSIQNPAQNYQSIFTSDTYEESLMWLLEDEYERVTGRFCQPE